jgi:hypothetical protein
MFLIERLKASGSRNNTVAACSKVAPCFPQLAEADLLQLAEEQVNKDRLYRALDELLVHKRALEAHLAKLYGELLAGRNEVLLYDVASTYFEGEAQGNALARRGYSRDHRTDC